MRLRLRMQKSTPTSDKSLEAAVSVEGRRLPGPRESKKTHECRARMFPLDRKVVRRCNRFVVAVARAPLRVRANHRVDQTRSIRLDKLLHTRARDHAIAAAIANIVLHEDGADLRPHD